MGLKGQIPWNKGKKLHYKIWNKGIKSWVKPWLGKKRSEETKLKIGIAKKGKHPSTKTEFKPGSKKAPNAYSWGSGPDNPRWKGGISKANRQKRYGIGLHQWRMTVLRRDKFLCQMPGCDKNESILEVHHIKRFQDFPELRVVLSNGITLCKQCHKLTKSKEEKYVELFTEIVKIK